MPVVWILKIRDILKNVFGSDYRDSQKNKLDCKGLIPYSGQLYQGTDKSLAQPTSRCIFFDGENISFDASHVIYINSTNIPPIMIINRIYERQYLLSL
jgi:hypothetical protein